MSLEQRLFAYEGICDKFSFLSELSNDSHEPENLKEKVKNLVDSHPDDLEINLENELIQFIEFIKNYKKNKNESEELFQYRTILGNNLCGTFLNIDIALRIYLSMMVSNSSGERSFSKMKLIKNRLRTSIEQERLVKSVKFRIRYCT